MNRDTINDFIGVINTNIKDTSKSNHIIGFAFDCYDDEEKFNTLYELITEYRKFNDSYKTMINDLTNYPTILFDRYNKKLIKK